MKTRFLSVGVIIAALLFAGEVEVELCGITFHLSQPEYNAFLTALSLIGGLVRSAGGAAPAPVSAALEPNLGQWGQWDHSIQFAALAPGWSFRTGPGGSVQLELGVFEKSRKVTLEIAGADRARRGAGEGLHADRVNYFVGADPSKWITDVPRFDGVRYTNVYPGIDAIHRFNDGRMETDFEVRPGADPTKIRVRFQGVQDLAVDPVDGALKMRTFAGDEIRWGQTRLFQSLANGKKRAIAGRIRILDVASVGFEVGDYDRGRTLVIDPVLSYLTYAGSNGSDGFVRMTTDANGNFYGVGATNDPAFPVSSGAFTASLPTAKTNATLIKLSADGSRRLYTTHFGGTSSDGATAVTLDTQGNIYITGFTLSEDFPVTATALQKNVPQNPLACFVTKLSPDGNRLLYSTYLTANGSHACTNIAVDASNAIYLTGVTNSARFPVTENAFQTNFRAGGVGLRGFVTKLNPAGTSLVYSTFLGGNVNDVPIGLAIDATGAAYVAGYTSSGSTFPVTQGAAQTQYGGAGGVLDVSFGDGYAVKLSPDGSRLIYGTFIGGRSDDIGYGIAVDSAGAAYVTGATLSTNFPVTQGAAQMTFGGSGGSGVASGDGFLVKLNPAGSAFVYATYLGGNRDERAGGVAVDKDGNAWVVGHTMSPNFPTTADAPQRRFGGSVQDLATTGDGFVTEIDTTGSKILFSTYLGGARNEFLNSVAIAQDGGVLFSGSTASRDLPVTPNASQRLGGGGEAVWEPFGDGFAGRIAELPPRVSVSRVSNLASLAAGVVSPGLPVAIEGTGMGPSDAVPGQPDGSGILPNSLAGTRVLIDGVAAPLVSVSEKRVIAVVPFGIAGKATAPLVVENGADRSAPVTLAIAAVSPGVFTVDESGVGQAKAWNDDLSENSQDSPAAPGSTMNLLISGAGVTDPPSIDGLVATVDARPSPVAPVTLVLGDIEVEYDWAAAAVNLPAGYTIVQFRLPDSLDSGMQEVRVRIGGVLSQRGVTIAVQRP